MDQQRSPDMPPIPTRTHHNLHPPRRSQANLQSTPTAVKRAGIRPANPEVITNLITSLSVIAEPASSHFDSQLATTSLSLPTSPNPGASSIVGPRHSSGSFGVDYGAYRRPSYQGDHPGPVSLDDLAASPPVIRTSRPPSGLSPLTAPHSPRSLHSASREGGLRSFIRNSTGSRPSSRGSHTSRNDDTQSIGNLSIERGSAPTPELRPRRSLDSWGKKANRSSKSITYMSSKERLRDGVTDRRRASAGNIVGGGGGSIGGGASSVHSNGKTDQFFAETAISEEPPAGEEPTGTDGPHQIPARESSLRKTSLSKKRSSVRRSKRDSDGAVEDTILEAAEPSSSRDGAKPGHGRSDSDAGKTFLYDVDEDSSPPKPRASGTYQADHAIVEEGTPNYEDGAPFPSVSQGRRRDEVVDKKRLSGRTSPAPNDSLRLKRSSSRLKRHSSPHAPQDRSKSFDEPIRNSKPTGYERPKSADSVDDAVESYLCSPRLSQKIRHPQTGRIISFSEVGDPEGSAVICCVGMGLTRYITAFYDELALTLKLRLITPDRPGVGDSEPYGDGTTTPLSWPDDVYAICQALKITKFSMMAHSAGAIYALATALRMPQHIRGRIHLLAPWIPPSQMNVFGTSQVSPPSHTLPTSQRILRALPTPILKAANSSFMSATSSSITSSLPKNPRRAKRKTGQKDANNAGSRNITPAMDKENLNQTMNGRESQASMTNNGAFASPKATENMDVLQAPVGNEGFSAVVDPLADKERQQTYDIRLTHAIWELATTNANPAVDLLVCLERRHTIGFRYVDITRPVIIHHGSRDTRVPVENVKWLGKTMRRCEVRVLEGEGHGLMASAAVMGSVLMEISKEWEDWMRVTGAEGRKDRDKSRRTGGK